MGIDNNDSNKFKIAKSTALSSTPRLTIDSSGNIGIGTTSPDYELDVAGGVGINDYIYHNGDDSKIGFEGNDAIRMYTANNVAIQIDSSQNVGIGNNSPPEKLTVGGNISASGGIFIDDFQVLTGDGTNTTLSASGDIYLNTGDDVYIRNAGSNYVRFDGTNQRVGIGTSSPSEKLQLDGGDLSLKSNGAIRFENTNDNNNWYIRNGGTSAATLQLGTGDSPGSNIKLTIDGDGDVGIGTTSVTNKLQVEGNISSSGAINTLSHITASGNISSSGTLIGGGINIKGTTRIEDDNVLITTGTTPLSLTSAVTIVGDLNTTTHITASGNITASNYLGKQLSHTYHQYNNDLSAAALFVPAPGAYVIEGTTVNYYRQWIAPYNGFLKKVIVYSENDMGSTRCYLYLNGSGTHRKTVTVGATTATTFDFTDTDTGTLSPVTAGQLLSFTVDPANAPGDVNIVMTWEYVIT